jgi:surface antigen Omp85-like protein
MSRIAGLTLACLAAAASLRAEGPADEQAPAPVVESGPPAAAPEGRAAEWQELRLGKRLRSPRGGLLQRLMIAGQDAPPLPFLTFPVHDFSLRPGDQRAGGGPSLILGYWDRERAAGQFNVFASAAYSLTRYQTYELRLGQVLPEVSDTWLHPRYLYVDLRRRDFPREAFFGLGPASRAAQETSYRLRDFSYELVGLSRLTGPLSGSLRFGGLSPDIGPGEETGVPSIEQVFTDAQAPGLLRQPRLLHAAAELRLDGRDRPRNAHSGGAIVLAAERYFGSDAFSFNRISVDARQVWSLGSPQRVLALRGYAGAARADPGSRVPFYLQDTLGDSHTLRGFADFRFRGPDALLFSAEYRWEAIPALELAVFEDVGTVAGRLSDLRLGVLRSDFGAGLRLKRSDGVLFRLDVARSTEETRLLASTSFSF